MNKIIFICLALVFALMPNQNIFSQNTEAKSNKTTTTHGHDEKLPLTAYNEHFEVFAEATPFVVGQPSNILGHFTFLSNYKPLEKGSITIRMIVGDKEVKQTLTRPTRKGIYLFKLTPPASGTAKIILNITTPNQTSELIIPNITVYTNRDDAQHAAISVLKGVSGGVVFIKEKSWMIDFATDLVKKQSLDGKSMLTVPNEAIIDDNGKSFVYIQVTPEYFEKQLIKKGKSNNIYTEILSGVSENQRIITKGTKLVKIEQAKIEEKAHVGHNH